MVKAFLLALLVIASVAAYPVVVIEHGGTVTVTRNTATSNQPVRYATPSTTFVSPRGQGDYFVGYEDGYNAGYLDGRNNRNSRSNPCIYAPYKDCSYYDRYEDYPYSIYNGYNNNYYPYQYNPYSGYPRYY